MDRSAISDPLGLEQFLFQATQSTSLTSPSVVDTLANFFVGFPNRRHLLSLVNEKVYGSTHHINKMEQELKKKQQLCTPEEAVKLVVDLRVPRRRYPILQKFITTFGQAFRHTTGMQWYPQLPSREKFSEAWTLLVGARNSCQLDTNTAGVQRYVDQRERRCQSCTRFFLPHCVP